jgi:hypothetical protein
VCVCVCVCVYMHLGSRWFIPSRSFVLGNGFDLLVLVLNS